MQRLELSRGIIEATDAANGNGALDVDSRYVNVRWRRFGIKGIN